MVSPQLLHSSVAFCSYLFINLFLSDKVILSRPTGLKVIIWQSDWLTGSTSGAAVSCLSTEGQWNHLNVSKFWFLYQLSLVGSAVTVPVVGSVVAWADVLTFSLINVAITTTAAAYGLVVSTFTCYCSNCHCCFWSTWFWYCCFHCCCYYYTSAVVAILTPFLLMLTLDSLWPIS